MNEQLTKLLDTPRGRDLAEAGRMACEAEYAEKKRREKQEAEAELVFRQAVTQPKGKIAPPLDAYSAADLYGKKLERPPLIVQGLIPAGLTVLAGAPKLGKSWLALSLGIAVAQGTDFLGLHTRQGEVLYLDLESRDYRVQDRLSKLLPGAAPAGLYISHDANRINAGLLDQLGTWVAEHPETSLIVIDTLARVKGGVGKNENAYEADSRIFGELQKFGQSHKLAIVVVHHLRKSRGDNTDPFERVSGSMGLTGVADAVLLLDGKRDEQTSTLHADSRDYERQELVLRFTGGTWSLQSTNSEAWREEQAYIKSDVVHGVLALMRDRQKWRGSASELLDEMMGATHMPIDIRANQLSAELSKLARALYEREGLAVRFAKSRGKRVIVLTHLSQNEL